VREVKFYICTVDENCMKTKHIVTLDDILNGELLYVSERETVEYKRQYTGVEDVYEGDIVKGRAFYGVPYRSKRFIGRVEFCSSVLAFIVVGVKQYEGISFRLSDVCRKEILGNKYENPELLEENK